MVLTDSKGQMHSTHVEQGGLFLSRKSRRILLLGQGNNLSLCKGEFESSPDLSCRLRSFYCCEFAYDHLC